MGPGLIRSPKLCKKKREKQLFNKRAKVIFQKSDVFPKLKKTIIRNLKPKTKAPIVAPSPPFYLFNVALHKVCNVRIDSLYVFQWKVFFYLHILYAYNARVVYFFI